MMEMLFAVVGASFVGSLHCVGMCGPLVGLFAADRGRGRVWLAQSLYHGARLVAYAGLGLFAGLLGQAFDQVGDLAGWSRAAAWFAGASIVLFGALQLLGGTRWSNRGPLGGLHRAFGRLLPRVMNQPVALRSSLLGAASALLPCGWLYGFVFTAAGTGSPVRGVLVMLAFWVGTVPALTGVGLGLRQLAGVLGRRVSVAMGVALVVLGIATVAFRGRMLVNAPGAAEGGSSHCSGHDSAHH